MIRQRANLTELADMLQALGSYVKLAVDVRREVLAGGGTLHADCESVLLGDGSKQEDIWGADWIPSLQEVTFESLINIRPRQNNRSMELQDPLLRQQVEAVTRKLLEGVTYERLD